MALLNSVANVLASNGKTSLPSVAIVGNEIYVEGVAITSNGGSKSGLAFTTNRTALTFLQDGTAYRVGLNGKGLRPVYDPADLNHVIGFGQSNMVGRDDLGNPSVTTTQPFSNVTLPDAGTLREYYDNGGSWAYEEWNSANGLRGQIRGTHKGDSISGESALGKNHTHYAGLLDAVTDFSDLIEGLYTNVSGGSSYHAPETVMSSACNALTWRNGKRFCATVAGVGGADPEHLTWAASSSGIVDVDLTTIDANCSGYGTGCFADMIKQVATCKRLADDQGLSYKVAAMIYFEMYTDREGAREIGEIINAANVQIKAITGQSEDVIMVTDADYGDQYGVRRGDDINAIAMHTNENIAYNGQSENWVDNNGRVYAGFNRLQYTKEETHYTPHERRGMGEKCAQIIDQVVFKSEEWEPVRIKEAWADGNDVFVRLHTTYPVLARPDPARNFTDTNGLLDKAGYHNTFGIQVYNAMVNGSKISTSAEVVGYDLIKFTCSSSPSGGSVRVGRDNYDRCMIHGGTLGNISETYAKDSNDNNYDQRDWLIGGFHPIS